MATVALPQNPYRADRAYDPQEARAYCARLAKSHYENFLVASLFVPKPLRQHFYNVYAYCRISDDLGDESGGPEQALPLLDAGSATVASALTYPHTQPLASALASPAFL